MELYLPVIKKQKRSRPTIIWTPDMIRMIIELFPVTYNKPLATKLGVSWRTLVRKARELNLEKEPGFLDNHRDEITALAVEAHPPHPHKGDINWSVPNSEHSRYKPGNISVMSTDPDVVQKVRANRNKTIHRERIRIKYGLPRLTKLNLK